MKLTENEVIDWWLEKYHNTNLMQVLIDHPEWNDGLDHSSDFYQTYAVTQQQHDEWYNWFISEVAKRYKISKKLAKRRTAFSYLNTSPNININK